MKEFLGAIEKKSDKELKEGEQQAKADREI